MLASAGPLPDLWPRFESHDPQSKHSVNHGFWQDLLQQFLIVGEDGINRVDYAAFLSKGLASLERYIGHLEATDVDRLNRPEQMAYWINFYNALTVFVVLRHYPVSSIRDIDISPGLFANGPWRRKLVSVLDEELSLDDIEHRILRPIWQDPRIHYAVNCAAIGCPNLQPEPFTAANLERVLDAAARAYVNDPRGFAIEQGFFGGQRVVASRIYDWFIEDFGGDEAGILAHLATHAVGETASQLPTIEGIDAYRYDWGLNDVG